MKNALYMNSLMPSDFITLSIIHLKYINKSILRIMKNRLNKCDYMLNFLLIYLLIFCIPFQVFGQKSEEKEDLDSRKISVNLTPSAMVNSAPMLQGGIKFSLSNIIDISSEFGYVIQGFSENPSTISGYRIRPAINFNLPWMKGRQNQIYLSLAYNYRYNVTNKNVNYVSTDDFSIETTVNTNVKRELKGPVYMFNIRTKTISKLNIIAGVGLGIGTLDNVYPEMPANILYSSNVPFFLRDFYEPGRQTLPLFIFHLSIELPFYY